MGLSRAAAIEYYHSVVIACQRDVDRHVDWCDYCTDEVMRCPYGEGYALKLSMAQENLRKAYA